MKDELPTDSKQPEKPHPTPKPALADLVLMKSSFKSHSDKDMELAWTEAEQNSK